MLVNIVILQWYGMSKEYLLKICHICLFRDNSPAAKDPVPTCALVWETMFGNEYVHVQKRAGDQYQCNKRDKGSDYLQCLVSKLIIIMQNYIFSIILIYEDNKIYDFI